MISVSVTTITAHLEGAVTSLRFVGTAKDLGAVKADAIVTPAAYLLPASERGGEQMYAHCDGLSQRVGFTFSVVLALRDIGDRRGDRAVDGIKTIRDEVMTVLALYQYPGADGYCLPTSGRLVSGVDRDGRLFWQDDYRISFHRNISGGSP
jgi:hypothetical protein